MEAAINNGEGPSYGDPISDIKRSVDRLEILIERQTDDLDDIRSRLGPIEKNLAMWIGAGRLVVWLGVVSGIVLTGFKIIFH